MSRVYVGNVDPRATERDLEDEFRMYGVLRSVWVARKPPGFAFVEFEDRRDAVGSGGVGSGDRVRSRSPRYRRSPSYGRSDLSPRGRSPRGYAGRSRSPVRPSYSSPHKGRSLSRSPPPRRDFKESPPLNGSPQIRDHRFNRSVSP